MQLTAVSPARLAALDAVPGVGIVNLEGPVAADGVLSAARLHNGPAVPGALAARGVGIIGIANNHRADRGPAGVATTVAAIEAAGAQALDVARPARLTVGDRAVLVVAGEPADGDAMVAALGASADLRIASLHVVAPPSYLPAPETRAVVDRLIAAGADVIAVHGSHALGPIEWRRGRLVAWGLGNLAFDCRCTREDEALILAIEAGPMGIEARILPIRAGLHGAPLTPHPDAAGVIALLRGLGSPVRADGSVVGVGAQADGEGDDVGR